MSIVFPKNKMKRSRSSSSEVTNSFVKNVTSRVSGLLPATIARWFSSPSSSNTNGSAPTAEVTDSSTEDEAPEEPTEIPPTKRMRYNSPGQFSNYPSTETSDATANIETLEPCIPFSNVQSPPVRTAFRPDTNFSSTPIRSPIEESTADKSEKDNNTFKSQHSISRIGSSVAPKRKSLFDLTSNSEASMKACAKTASNTMRDPKEPCFKPSLLGSPFYPGRTMYGGASASYIYQPNITQRKNTVVNEKNSTENNNISYSARRIMDLLEHYSSPLNEAKRIPQYVPPARSSSLDTLPRGHKVFSYKTQELYVPSIASIMQIKKRSRLNATTTMARQILASHSSTAHTLPYPTVNTQRSDPEIEPINKLNTKIKSRLTRPNRGDRSDLETDLPTPVELPTATLQIHQDQLPKFSFGIPTVSNTSNTTRTHSAGENIMKFTEIKSTTKITETPIRKPESVSIMNPYKFSSPVRISSEQSQNSTTLPKFTFGSPERSIDISKVTEMKKDEPSSFVGTAKDEIRGVTLKSKDWNCSTCWTSNNADAEKCVCGDQRPPRDDINKPAYSLGDKATSNFANCIGGDKIKVNNVSKPLILKPLESSNWTCKDCWVKNDDSVDSCVCCGGANPDKAAAVKQKAVVNNTDAEWKCDDCWIKNKSTADQCAACGGARPGGKQNVVPTASSSLILPPATNNSFKITLKKPESERWECNICLVKNNSNRATCICCEMVKPGTITEEQRRSFKFGVNKDFKFGIELEMEQAAAKLKETTATNSGFKAVSELSETNNNVLDKAPSFTFGVPAKKCEDQTDAPRTNKVEEKPGGAPKVNFTFGIPNSTSVAVPSVSFGSILQPTPKVTDEEKEKPQEVPKVDFSISKTQESPKQSPNLFTPPLCSQVNQEPKTSASPAVNSITSEKNNSLPSLPQTVTNTEATQAPSFTFKLAVKPSVSMFSAPATTATTSAIPFAAPVQNPPATDSLTMFQKSEPSIFQKSEPTASTSAISVFQKNDSASPSVSLFQKSETSTAAPPSLGATAPIFGFGTSAQTAPAQPEKPSFNFTFGSNNKADAAAVFQPTFGAATDNNSTNQFALTTANTMGNALSSNTLTSGNGSHLTSNVLSGGNSLSTNALGGGSDLGSNPLASTSSLQPGSGIPMPSGGMFGAAVQKENMWSPNNNTSSNMFASIATPSSMPKAGAFTFGSSTPFNAPSATPQFGSGSQSTPNMFGMANNNQASSQGSMFPSPAPSQPAPSIFASPQPASNPAPAMGMFGSPSLGAAPTFGTPNPSLPPFEAPSLTPAPAPAFNFGAPQSTNVFGFGQQMPQQQQQQQPSTSMYNFGAAPAPAGGPQVQFNMGSAPNMAGRRVRKAVRRNPQR